MKKKIQTSQVTTKQVMILTLIFILTIIGMNIAATQLNESVLDFRINYTSVEAYHFFQHLGAKGRHFYFITLMFDFIFPIIYMLFGVSLALFIINKQKNYPRWQTIFIFLPIFAMISDWIENIFILLMLRSYDRSFLDLSIYSSTVTLLKFSILGIFIFGMITLTIQIFITKRNRIK